MICGSASNICADNVASFDRISFHGCIRFSIRCIIAVFMLIICCSYDIGLSSSLESSSICNCLFFSCNIFICSISDSAILFSFGVFASCFVYYIEVLLV